jgi:preprotein translocase subunit SecG
MLALLTTIHVLVAVSLILIVLLQSARGTDLAGAFGGMGSQAAFGPRGTTTFLSKATVVLAAVFMATSISLAILANRSRGGDESILSGQETGAPTGQTAPPAMPGGSPAAPQVQTQGLPPGVQVRVEQAPPEGETEGQGAAPAQAAPPEAPAQTGAPAAPPQTP